jgi:multiple sugar transport system ATP-binding protein
MARVELKNVSKTFRQKQSGDVHAVRDLNLTIADKELVVLLGPSGCGKTTTLRLIAGLEEVSSGNISINDAPMNKVPPQDRDVAMVFQRDALYPHMTVFENMAFGLKLRRIAKPEIRSRVNSTAEMLGIAPLLDRYPRALSGGERQRAALGRALARKPNLLLLDEPLSQLDRPLRAQLRKEISRLHAQLGLTMLYVTHDQSEALALTACRQHPAGVSQNPVSTSTPSTRLALMRLGSIEQVGDSQTLLKHPANAFVADFFGAE